MLHGAGSCGANHTAFVAAAQAYGWDAAAPDLPGHGSFATTPLADPIPWVRGLCTPGTILRGSSFGAYLALHTAARESSVAAVIALCPTGEGLIRERFRDWDAAIDEPAFVRFLDESDIYDAVTLIAVPVLYVTARDDERIPLAHVDRLHELTPRSELVVLDTGGHTGPSHDETVHAPTLDWLERAPSARPRPHSRHGV